MKWKGPRLIDDGLVPIRRVGLAQTSPTEGLDRPAIQGFCLRPMRRIVHLDVSPDLRNGPESAN
jgi:hypothetical protein